MADFVTRIILQNEQFKKEISECKKKMKELKASGKNAGGSMNEFQSILNKVGIKTNSTGGLLGGLGGTLTKLGGFFGVAMTAGALFNKMMDNSQTLGDAVEKAQISAGNAVDYFATCLVNADFSGFLDGLRNSISEAGTLADMLDELATNAQRLGVIDARTAAKKSQANKEYYQATTKQGRLDAAKKMEEADKEARAAHKKFGKDNLHTARQLIKSKINPQLNGLHITDNQIDQYFKNEVKFAEQGEKTNKRLKAIHSERDRILSKANKQKKKDDFKNQNDFSYTSKKKSAYISSADKKRLSELAAQEKSLKRTTGYAYARMNELQDNKEDSPMTAARRYYTQYYNQDKFVTDQEALTARKKLRAETFSGIGGSKKTSSKKTGGKITGDKLTGDKVFNANAVTVQQISDNVDILTDKLKKCVPNTDEYKAVETSLDSWTSKLSLIGFDAQAKSIKGINENINILSEKLENLDPNTDAFKDTKKQLDQWQTKLDDINNNGFNESASSIKDINNNIQILNYRLEKTTPRTAEWKEVTEQIKKQKQLLSEFSVGSISDLNSQISEIDEKLQNETLSINARIKLQTKKKDLQDAIDNISDTTTIKIVKLDYQTQNKVSSFDNAQSNIESIKKQNDLGIIDKSSADKQIADINKQLQSLGLQPIKVHIETDLEKGFNSFRNNAENIMGAFDGINNVVNSVESLSNAVADGANGFEIFMGVIQTVGTTLQSFSQIMTAVNTITELLGATTTTTAALDSAATAQQVANSQAKVAANSSEAISGATKSGASLPFPYNIAAIAAGVAAVVSALAMVGSFADGGIVGGNSFHGGKLVARVNSNEMILNTKQQKQLFNVLDSNSVNTGNNSASVVKIKGSDLYIALSNYNSKMGKIR